MRHYNILQAVKRNGVATMSIINQQNKMASIGGNAVVLPIKGDCSSSQPRPVEASSLEYIMIGKTSKQRLARKAELANKPLIREGNMLTREQYVLTDGTKVYGQSLMSLDEFRRMRNQATGGNLYWARSTGKRPANTTGLTGAK